jgi:hypothetical protein
MSTALYLNRALSLGLTLADLESVGVGTVIDMITESENDSYDYPIKATQADFDKFAKG